ncbi:DsrE family protein [Desulfoplanes formicivorans]|uniref:DsrE family protein n=1 Tax=Desulfoplanes formicivorans TaxID=1592317 RepID=UPI0008533F5E|nr:DsrE family protein [Desulfoplanes formicivorans]
MSPLSPKKLNILWTNDNPVTAELMVFMYAITAKERKLWDEITLIIWGATVKLVKENEDIQALVQKAQRSGVHVSACRACADELDAVKTLEALHVEVIYWGAPLTEILQNNGKLITI